MGIPRIFDMRFQIPVSEHVTDFGWVPFHYVGRPKEEIHKTQNTNPKINKLALVKTHTHTHAKPNPKSVHQ